MGLIILILAGAVGGLIWQVWRRLEWERENHLATHACRRLPTFEEARSAHAYDDWGYDPETADEPLDEAEIDLLMPWYRDPTTPTSEASNE